MQEPGWAVLLVVPYGGWDDYGSTTGLYIALTHVFKTSSTLISDQTFGLKLG